MSKQTHEEAQRALQELLVVTGQALIGAFGTTPEQKARTEDILLELRTELAAENPSLGFAAVAETIEGAQASNWARDVPPHLLNWARR